MTHQQAYEKLILGAALALGLSSLGSSGASADAILTYTGNTFTTVIGSSYTTSDKVTASITLSSPLGDSLNLATVFPLSFTIQDGVQTLTQSSPTSLTLFQFSTSATGEITNWVVNVATGNPPFIFTMNMPGDMEDEGDATTTGAGEVGHNMGEPGIFTCASGCTTSTVPEPASLTLLGSALAGLGLLRRRRKSV